ncbi:MAG: methyltransferase [Oscillospiraceae bacterium]|nr:methyltransferase [Oscillospiraceae bacterium]
MAVPAFDPKELTVVREVPGFLPGAEPTPIFSYPVTPKEGFISLLKRQPIWQMSGTEQTMFCPRVHPDNVARAFIMDGTGINMTEGGGSDMFGIEWEYVPQAGGSMVRPGKPFIEDANEIADKVVWPDIDAWDWEEAVKVNKEFLSTDNFIVCWIMNGWYERLISFMDFEGAVMAVFDEDQQDAVKAFFTKLSELYIKLIDKYLECFPEIDGFCIHDDWGSQRETFFSPAIAEEMIVPYMKMVTDHIHSKGKFADLHSCGQLFKQVPNMIAAGWDSWSGQAMNDTHKIYELYGDKILIGVIPETYDPADKSEEAQREAAREYANKFCNPKKPSVLSAFGLTMLNKAYREELYKQSRINYSK